MLQMYKFVMSQISVLPYIHALQKNKKKSLYSSLIQHNLENHKWEMY